MQNDVRACAGFDTRRLFSHSSAEEGKVSLCSPTLQYASYKSMMLKFISPSAHKLSIDFLVQ